MTIEKEFEDEIVLDSKSFTVERVLTLARQGLKYQEIGDLVGLSRQRVSQICLEHRIIRRPSDIKPENWERYWEKDKEVN